MTDYDDFPYDDFPFALTHPDHLATLATLFGLRPTPPSRCRILELGCGLGGNLIPMALTLPGSEILGVDRSARQIASGKADIEALGLRNIELLPIDIMDIDPSFGAFDYILCHGVYSWVPAAVQAKILAICKALLTPQGVAYISYNALPGWHLRGMIRDLLRREVGPSGTPAERVARARAFLRFVAEAPASLGPAQAWLKGELELLDQLSDAYLYYEHLVDICTPMYFQDFARDAERAGLSYLADAHFQSMLPGRLGEAVEQQVAERSRSIIDTEHTMDVLEQRSFRRTLLCHREVQVDREITYRRLEGLWVSTRLSPVSLSPDLTGDGSEGFARPGSEELCTTLPILKAALVLLARDYPRGLPFDDLWQMASALLRGGEEGKARLGSNLLGLYAQGHVDLSTHERPYVTTPGPLPCTTPLIRLQAKRDPHGCTSLRHQKVGVDVLQRALLSRLDGTHTREALLADLADDEITMDRLQAELARLGVAALLLA